MRFVGRVRCGVERFVPWDFLSLVAFCSLGRFVPWDVLSVGHFVPWDVLSFDVFSVHSTASRVSFNNILYPLFMSLTHPGPLFIY